MFSLQQSFQFLLWWPWDRPRWGLCLESRHPWRWSEASSFAAGLLLRSLLVLPSNVFFLRLWYTLLQRILQQWCWWHPWVLGSWALVWRYHLLVAAGVVSRPFGLSPGLLEDVYFRGFVPVVSELAPSPLQTASDVPPEWAPQSYPSTSRIHMWCDHSFGENDNA